MAEHSSKILANEEKATVTIRGSHKYHILNIPLMFCDISNKFQSETIWDTTPELHYF